MANITAQDIIRKNWDLIFYPDIVAAAVACANVAEMGNREYLQYWYDGA